MTRTLELDDRIVKCQRILDEDPNSQIFAALAEAYRKKGELDKAFTICRNGLKVHSKYGSAHLVMAKINLDRGLYDWAEIELNAASEIDGNTRPIEVLFAEIFIYKGEFQKAINKLKKLHIADPTNEQVKKLLDIAKKIPEEQTVIMQSKKKNSVPEISDEKIEVVKRVESPREPVSPQEIIESAVTIPGIDGSLFITFEGLIVDSEWSLQMNSELCAAQLVAIGNLLNNELKPKSFGEVRTILIETDGTTFYQVYKEDGIYVFVAKSTLNLGSIRMKIENLLGNK